MGIARYFDESHDDGSFFGGVPKADIDEEAWNSYPDWLQASVDASSMYRKSKPAATKAPDKPKDGD